MESVDNLVSALCADYTRRRELIQRGGLSRRVETELRYLNAKIIDATLELAPEEELFGFIEEIGRGIGYAKSSLYHLSETTYKKRKREIKTNIAKKLYLTE